MFTTLPLEPNNNNITPHYGGNTNLIEESFAKHKSHALKVLYFLIIKNINFYQITKWRGSQINFTDEFQVKPS